MRAGPASGQSVLASELAMGDRVTVHHEALLGGRPHPYRGCAGTVFKPVRGDTGEWIVALDGHGPVCLTPPEMVTAE